MHFTQHAQVRLSSRRLSQTAVDAALSYGREVHTRGAVFYVIGRKEVEFARRDGIDISADEGIHVVCSSEDEVVTAYRNRNLSRLKPSRRSRSYRYNRKCSIPIWYTPPWPAR